MSNETFVVKREENLSSEKLFCEFNKVIVIGRIESEFEYSHEVLLEKFYHTKIKVKRLSGTEDLVPIIVSDLLIGKERLKKSLKGKRIEVIGEFRTHKKIRKDGHKSLELFLFAKKITIYEDELEENTNTIYLDGYICKQPVFRDTPLGKQITDLIIEVKRAYGKKDFIPCVAWGIVALWASELKVGDRVKLYGRVQSRKYLKRYSQDSDEGEYRDAYEISIMRMQKVDD